MRRNSKNLLDILFVAISLSIARFQNFTKFKELRYLYIVDSYNNEMFFHTIPTSICASDTRYISSILTKQFSLITFDDSKALVSRCYEKLFTIMKLHRKRIVINNQSADCYLCNLCKFISL